MGRDKSQLVWGAVNFLAHAISRMQQVCDRVFVVGEKAEAGVPLLKDIFGGSGPLAGIHTALQHTGSKWNLVLAVDMPLVSAALLNFIASHCDRSSFAIIPKTATFRVSAKKGLEGGHNRRSPALQPLCAAYHREFLPTIERALSNRELSIRRLLEEAAQGMMNEPPQAIRFIDEQELSAAGFSPEMLMNVNTPSDLERARALARDLDVK